VRLFLLFSFFILIGFANLGFATHNRSGEITYRHISGNTYEFTITTCTKLSSDANRPELEIDFGDGIIDTLLLVDFENYQATDTKKNIYRGLHTYSGPGSYLISVSDPNRNANVVNISASVDQIFCIQSQLIISPFLGQPNNSLILEDCPCPEEACANIPWEYNLGAYDPDGDSLSYELIPCKGENCEAMSIPDIFRYPNDAGGGNFSLNVFTGTISWDSPVINGEYNFAIKIKEYRKGTLIGFVIRDMQLTVIGDCKNTPPIIETFPDTCLAVGFAFTDTINGTDSPADPTDIPELSWAYFGEGFNLLNTPATFNNFDAPGNPISGLFSWTPSCENVREQEYLFTFKVEDNGPYVRLKDIETRSIKVTGEALKNVAVSASLNKSQTTWNKGECSSIVGYNIYRKQDSTYSENKCCSPGSTLGFGYELIGSTTSIADTAYEDLGPFVVGNKYCYIVTSIYKSRSESCMSIPSCFELPFDLPVMTQVSVNMTEIAGEDSIRWLAPKELDTNLYFGPFTYLLYRSEYPEIPLELIFESNTTDSLHLLDSLFVDTAVNTLDKQYTYRLELLNDGISIGYSAPASSMYIQATPNDNQVALSWESPVPWSNFRYEISRSADSNLMYFIVLDTVNSRYYLDDSLVNGDLHCYKIRSIGKYSHPLLPDTLYNWSQIVCISATDLTAPCAPSSIDIQSDCDREENLITWNNPNNSCSDDVVAYQVWYAPKKNTPFTQIAEISSDQDTSYLFQGEGNISGCYYITASDSAQYNNVSVPSEIICVDNCTPVYKLPNVFTPNADGINDLYHPLLPYKFISRVDLTIVNRWGDIVFQTSDPLLNWTGIDQLKNLPLLEGVYFYTGTAYGISLNGEIPIPLHGYIHLVYNKQ
jgi:gliding motility-associated-like protein